jgi:hypothetical protein
MPSNNQTFQGKTRAFDVRPDRYDVRDRKYQPRLVNLPATYPSVEFADQMLVNYNKLVLDQGEEGACTGFGLAAMINYLRFREEFFPDPFTGKFKPSPTMPEKVSERMLYEHARLYDEWPGEDYDGSSCRGAMKGWHRHGVCLKKTWPYLDGKGEPGKPKGNWAVQAAQIALGAYFRVETDDITALQSAIHEVGAIYCSADVHAGWELGDGNKLVGNLPVIQWKPRAKSAGGHAFALVGYNCHGFIVQNSWGVKWGYQGFALLTYGDWLQNATDAWVATMGVPVIQGEVPTTYTTRSLNRVSASAPVGDAAPGAPKVWTEDEARRHSLVLGNDGVLLRSSAAHDGPGFLNEVVMEGVRAWFKASKTNRKIAIYAHGGLNDEEGAIKRVQTMAPHFKANGVYPIFIVWKTGWKESLRDIGTDVLTKILPADALPGQAGGIGAWLREKVSDGADYTVETALGFLGKSLWRQMKQNAQSAEQQGRGAEVLATAIATLQKQFTTAEIHLAGHSAGSIWLGHFVSTLRALKSVGASSCHLFAPACTVSFANDHYGKAINSKFLPATSLWVHNLSEKGRARGQRRRLLRQVAPVFREPRL